MLIFDFHAIGNRLYTIRKQQGKTQADVAEEAGLSDRTYAEIERGTVNMRIETVLRICKALHITPDVILTSETTDMAEEERELLARLENCSPKEKETALRLLAVYFASLDR